MQVTNLSLSEEELAVLVNKRFFDIKHKVTRNIMEEFAALELIVKPLWQASEISFPGLNRDAGKIFRGENYNGYPYIVLDYPRLFNKQEVFAGRTMLWWGNDISFTLHLQGRAWDHYKDQITMGLTESTLADLDICILDNPWEYHRQKDNYIPLNTFLKYHGDVEIKNLPFLKLSQSMAITDYRLIRERGRNFYAEMITLIGNQEPM